MLIRSISILFLSTWVLVMPAQAAEALSSASIAALADKLELTSQQREQVNKLIVRYAAKAAELQKESVALRQDMQLQPLPEMTRSTIAAMSQRAGSVAARHTGSILQTQMEFYGLLTPSQQAEYRRLRKAGQEKTGVSAAQ